MSFMDIVFGSSVSPQFLKIAKCKATIEKYFYSLRYIITRTTMGVMLRDLRVLVFSTTVSYMCYKAHIMEKNSIHCYKGKIVYSVSQRRVRPCHSFNIHILGVGYFVF